MMCFCSVGCEITIPSSVCLDTSNEAPPLLLLLHGSRLRAL
jgi:hypothetical protein